MRVPPERESVRLNVGQWFLWRQRLGVLNLWRGCRWLPRRTVLNVYCPARILYVSLWSTAPRRLAMLVCSSIVSMGERVANPVIRISGYTRCPLSPALK